MGASETNEARAVALHADVIVDAMRRGLELARRGPARGVNPQVGCVILAADGTVLAEGWHRGAGTAHAETDALSQLGPGAAAGSTAVVTLEPCNHTGRTGPCAQALLDAGVSRVVYSVDDPGQRSRGGADRLRSAGVDVSSGVLRSEGEALLGDWLTTARLGRPIVTAKWAQSLDGRAAAADGTSQWVTGPDARADVHARRAAADAIGVGTGTLLSDDPSLTARTSSGELYPTQPVPVVFGHREIPDSAAVRHHPHALVHLPGDDLAADLVGLHALGIRSLFLEGGPALISSFLTAGLVDEYLVYIAPVLLGGPHTALTDIGVGSISDARRLTVDDVHTLGDDLLIVAHPKGHA
ncbi:diaminohydroxyphosphoribosylaminopyrimidine deaminase/5-amino-6-(5-phosphoribosylamino)uracil reductase [Mycetocola sp. CAN_C7]|uniref:bifunctional diaminohydroxyphosphoribosylaminopyrimidine deaminase/5-amino-6-(5-phosphoribosylamino)uracil reductase RibD n=1 Tax=Mycetocola sp. CAN_C7 TaxID=2787724 RepID=UPI001A1E694F